LLEWLVQETDERVHELWEAYLAKGLRDEGIEASLSHQDDPRAWEGVFDKVADERVMKKFVQFFDISRTLKELQIVNLLMDNWLTTSIYQVGMYNEAECSIFPSEQEIESLLGNLNGEPADCRELKRIEREVSDLDNLIAEATAIVVDLKSHQSILSVWRQKSARTKEVMGVLYDSFSDVATSLASTLPPETRTQNPVPSRSAVVDGGDSDAFTTFLATILTNVGVGS
jgi:hypothetical protein